MSGYVRIHRTLIGHPVFRNDAEAMVFAWLIAQAQWRSTRVRYRDRIVELERGQLAISLRDLATRFDRDKAWIGRLLKRLKNETMIETRSETGVNLITICKYNEYQADPTASETAGEPPRETGVRQGRDTEQVREKGKKEKLEQPEWLPVSDWLAYVEMRKAMRVPFTLSAQRGIVSDLAKLRAEGHDPAKVLAKAVKRGWRGVFGDDDTMADKPVIEPAEQIAQLERMIPIYRERGDVQHAERAAEIIASLREHPPDPKVVSLVGSAAMSLRRA